MSRGKRAAVLGCGPAGIFAAQAFTEAGWRVKLFSKKRRSEMFGAQYLHSPIPGLSDPDAFSLVEYVLQGSADDYRSKVYGPKSRVEVSPSGIVEGDIAAPRIVIAEGAFFKGRVEMRGDRAPGERGPRGAGQPEPKRAVDAGT